MEYLVTMATHIPGDISDDTVAQLCRREAARTRDLASQGILRRLWHPPRQPGERRTLGLFVAADVERLNNVLASLPLMVWRTENVTPLSPHPSDPGLPGAGDMQEFLVATTIAIPRGTPATVVDDRVGREVLRTRELSSQGHLRRLWALCAADGARCSLGLWNARDAAHLTSILESMPLYAWMTVVTAAMTTDPSDPAGPAAHP